MPRKAHSIRGVPCWLCNSLTIKTLSFEVDQSETITVGEAAELLDLHPRSITNRAKSGALAGAHKDKAGRWRIPRGEVERVLKEREEDPRGKPGKKPREDTAVPQLVEVLNGQIEDLRADRDAWREQARRSDYLLGGALERTRELESRLREIEAPTPDRPSEARESDLSDSPTRTPTDPTPAPHTDIQGRGKTLWRRLLDRYG